MIDSFYGKALPWMDGWKGFLMNPLHPLLASIAYLVVIFGLRFIISLRGPRSKPSPSPSPSPSSSSSSSLEVRTILLILHNVFLSIFSFIMLVGSLHEVYVQMYQKGVSLYDLWCDPNKSHLNDRLYFWVWIFHISKYYEFIDTIFIVLAKKPLEFLHVYHHLLTLWITWAGIHYDMTFQWMGTVTNTFVHTFMYYYYAASALGIRVWWKEYLTMTQMIQFWINMIVLVLWELVHYQYGCSGSSFSWFLTIFANATFYLLFLKFYRRTYTRRPPSSSSSPSSSASKPKSN